MRLSRITDHCVLFLVSFSSYDLMVACKDIGEGKLHIPELLGDLKINPITAEGAYGIKMDAKTVRNEKLLELLQRYTYRTSFSESNTHNHST